MTEHYSFFDAVQDSNGNYDREYNAQQFTDYFKSLVTTGVMKGAYNQLEVTANGSNMVSAVKSGVAFVEGRYYYNDALVELTHDTEVIGLSRIDRIVVRMDTRTEARHVKIFIKKGVPNSNPVAPTLTQTPTVYEISLAQVRVVGGQTFVAANAVTDERGLAIISPWAGSKILPSFSDNALANHIEDAIIHNNFATNTAYDSSSNTISIIKEDLQLVDGLTITFRVPDTVAFGYSKLTLNDGLSKYMGDMYGKLMVANKLKKDSIVTVVYNEKLNTWQLANFTDDSETTSAIAIVPNLPFTNTFPGSLRYNKKGGYNTLRIQLTCSSTLNAADYNIGTLPVEAKPSELVVGYVLIESNGKNFVPVSIDTDGIIKLHCNTNINSGSSIKGMVIYI